MNTPDTPEKSGASDTEAKPEGAAAPDLPTTPEAEKNAGLYDRFVELSRDIYAAGQDKSREAMEKAMEKARVQMTAAGDFTSEKGEKFKGYMRRDLEQTRDTMRKLGDSAKEKLNPSRLGAGALSSLSKILKAAGEALSGLSVKTETALEYHSGEITTAGTLTCVSCGEKIPLRDTSMVPDCPKCGGTRFRKGY